MGPLQLAVTWYKIRHAGEQAVHWDIQNKATSSRQICIFFVLDVPVRACSPAWRILYHVTASCKGPILLQVALHFHPDHAQPKIINTSFCTLVRNCDQNRIISITLPWMGLWSMGPLHLTVTCRSVSYAQGHPKQSDFIQSNLNFLCFEVPVCSLLSSMVDLVPCNRLYGPLEGQCHGRYLV